MNLTVESLINSILSTHDLKALQHELRSVIADQRESEQAKLRDAMIADLLNRPIAEIPANAEPGVFPGS